VIKKALLILIFPFISACVPEIPTSLKDFLFPEEPRESITKGLSPKGLFSLAKEHERNGETDLAINAFNQLQAAYPSSKYSIQAKLEIIYTLYKRERYDEAISELNDYIKLYPNHFSTPYAYYMRALSSEAKSKSVLDEFEITDNAQRDIKSVQDAFNYYLALIKKFPNSQYSVESKSILVKLRNVLSRHELFVAIFYFNQEAYIASINRCKFIIETYPNTPSVPAAIHLMMENYKKIGANDLANDAKRVLQLSYPEYIPHYTLEIDESK